VYPANPTIYNVQWAVDFFKECVALGAHSLYIKDPSGVLTPEMAGALCRQVKEAFPDKPLCLHTHYQTGFGYMTYLEAVKNGANGVECSVGFADGAGQPYSLTMLRAFEDYGFHTGKPNKTALTKIADLCKKMRPLYTSASQVRTPDINVEMTGIAGGQRTILDKELIDANQPHLIPLVDIEVQKVRAEGGKVCQVTPVADTYAREAVRRLRGGSPDSGFIPGFSGILVGEGGRVMDPVNKVKQAQVFKERLSAKIKELNVLANKPKEQAIAIEAVIAIMKDLADPIVIQQRLDEVSSRIKQLEFISTKPQLLSSLNLKIQMAKERGLSTLVDTKEEIGNLKNELDSLVASLAKAKQVADIGQKAYEDILKKKAPDTVYSDLAKKNSAITHLLQDKLITLDTFKQLLAVGGFITCAHSDLIPNGMDNARKELEAIENKFLLGTNETPQLKEELAILQACFGKAAIPNLYLNFLKNYRENLSYWPALYQGHVRQGMVQMKKKPVNSPLYKHGKVAELLGDQKISEMTTIYKTIEHFQRRLANQDKYLKFWQAEQKQDPAIFKKQLNSTTIDLIKARIADLEAQLKNKKVEATKSLQALFTPPQVAGSRIHIDAKEAAELVNDIVMQEASKE
jgi:predicted translin family RNA/ssDNA-binding protein